MKAKKYTNSSWTEGDYEKEYSTAIDTYTTLPATFQTSGADVVNYQVYGASSGVGEETENIVPTFSDAILGDEITFTVLSDNSVKINGSDASVRFYGTQMRLAEGTYSMKSFIPFAGGLTSIRVDIRQGTTSGSVISNAVDDYGGVTFTVDSTVASKTLYFVIRVAANYVCDNIILKPTLVTGSTIPTSFIPKGYKIPILNTSGVTENLVPEISTANGWRPGYINSNGSYNPNNTNGEWLSPYIDINITMALPITIKYKPVSSSASLSLYFFDANGDYISKKTSNTNGNAVFTTEIPTNATKMSYAFRTYCITEQDLIRAEMWTSFYAPYRYEQNYDLFIGDTKLGENDLLDFSEQKVFTNTVTTVFNGSENWQYYGVFGGHNTFYYDYGASTSKAFIVLLCNKYESTDDATPEGTKNNTVRYQASAQGRNINRIYIFDDRFDNLSDFKDHLQGLYSSGDPLIVTRQTATSESKDPPLPFPTISTYIGENNLSVDTTVQPEKVVCEYQGWKQAGSDGEVRYYHNGWVNTPPPAKPSWLADGYEAVLDAKTAPSNYYCDLAYVENGIQMVYRVYVSTDTTCQIEHPDNYISVFQSPYSSSFRGFTTYGVRYNNEVWNVATTTSNQDRGQTAYASIASQRAILSSTITNLTNASGYTFEDYR